MHSSSSAFYVSIRTRVASCRWSEVVTHVPCGGSAGFPAGRLLITATLAEIDGVGNILGYAGPDLVWLYCPSISLTGSMTFDIQDIGAIIAAGLFEGVVLHEMGHVIGVGYVHLHGYNTRSVGLIAVLVTLNVDISAFIDVLRSTPETMLGAWESTAPLTRWDIGLAVHALWLWPASRLSQHRHNKGAREKNI